MSAKQRDLSVTHKIMSSIPSKNTEPELLLRKALWKENFRYRVNYKKLPGKPDVVFTKYRVAVFCDGDFWHGHNWAIRGLGSLEEELSGYTDFWQKKIRRNIQRDNDVNNTLSEMGWTVVRIWESDIRKDVNACVSVIRDALIVAEANNQEESALQDSTCKTTPVVS